MKMKIATLAPLMLALCSCVASAAYTGQGGIGSIALESCTAAKHARPDKASIAALINSPYSPEDPGLALKPNEILQFRWADLDGNGGCELVMMLRYGPNFGTIAIVWKDHNQTFLGEANLDTAIKDLNGDGRKEIVLHSYLDLGGNRAATGVTPVWPQVYRLKDEKYIPASKDFPGFYETEILPKLDKEIAQTPYPGEEAVAALEMQRDKILRVLGRDPNAGLEKAREWAKSDNPQLVEDAFDVFHDIPGHEAEAHAAEQAEKQAWQHWFATHKK